MSSHPLFTRYEAAIRQISPGLEVREVSVNSEGLVNDVVIINGQWVYRFAKNEYGKTALANELLILEAIRPHLKLAIPAPFYASPEAIAYPLIDGVDFDRRVVRGLEEADLQAAADQLADFLHALHNVPLTNALPKTLAPVGYADWLRIRGRVEENVYPLLMKHQLAWAKELFDSMMNDPQNFAFTPALIHGDLNCYHILYQPRTRRLSGVLDFGTGGVGDPANDLACLLQYYGGGFVERVLRRYPADGAIMKRARFHAQTIELEWALNGLESGESFWFTAHLGNARGHEL